MYMKHWVSQEAFVVTLLCLFVYVGIVVVSCDDCQGHCTCVVNKYYFYTVPAVRHKCTFKGGLYMNQIFPYKSRNSAFIIYLFLGILIDFWAFLCQISGKDSQLAFFSFFRSGNVCWCVKGKTNSCGPVIFPEFDIYYYNMTSLKRHTR